MAGLESAAEVEKGLGPGLHARVPQWEPHARSSVPETPQLPSPTLTRFPYISRRRSWLTVALLVAVSSASIILLSGVFWRRSARENVRMSSAVNASLDVHWNGMPDHLKTANFINGHPTVRFRGMFWNIFPWNSGLIVLQITSGMTHDT